MTGAAAIDDEESAMGSDATFDEVMRRVRAGDGAAETALFQQYVRRLIVLAARQFDASLRDRADVELPAGRHAPIMAGGKDIYAERAWCPPLLMQ